MKARYEEYEKHGIEDLLIEALLKEWHKSGKDKEISFVEWLELNYEWS